MWGKLIVYRLLALLAAGFSAAALADYLRPEPLYCGLQSGCAVVTGSAYGSPAGIPLPVVGLTAFAGFYVVTLLPGGWWTRGLLSVASVAAGFAGLALLVIQLVVLRQVCQLCLIIDCCALLLALTALAWPTPGADVPRARYWAAWVAVFVLAAAGPPVLARYLSPPPPLPAEVVALQKPGRLTIVFVTDFSCAHCRDTHPALREAVAGADDVDVVFLVYPRADQPNSVTAARAYHCADAQGKGAEMAEALFALDDANAAACERQAARLGLDLERYRGCLHSPDVEAKLAQARWVESAKVPGLPAIWVGKRRLTGLQTKEQLREALRLAGQGR